jgi:hypothetical protein
MFECVCVLVICGGVGFAGWKVCGPGRRTRDGVEAVEMHRKIVAAAVLVAIEGTASAVLVSGIHDDQLRAVMTLSSVLTVTGGLYSVYCAVKQMKTPAVAAVATTEHGQRRDDDIKREVWLQAAAEFGKDADTSPMEIRLTGSLRSIREQAEQGLFASDDEKARHLAAIWSMAACDLDDDLGQVAH